MDETCGGCVFLRGGYWGVRNLYQCWCEKVGRNLSGTLEKLEECKRGGWKEGSCNGGEFGKR